MYFPIPYRHVATTQRVILGTVGVWVVMACLTIPTAYHVSGYNYNLVAKQVRGIIALYRYKFLYKF